MFDCWPELSCWQHCMLYLYVSIVVHLVMNLIFHRLFVYSVIGLGSLKGLVICGDHWSA